MKNGIGVIRLEMDKYLNFLKSKNVEIKLYKFNINR